MDVRWSSIAARRSTRVLVCDDWPESDWAAHCERLLISGDASRFSVRRVAGTDKVGLHRRYPDEPELAILVVSPTNESRGCALLKTLGGLHPSVPILVLSEAADEATLVRFLKAGASDLITVPLRDAEVLARLARWRWSPSEVAGAVKILTREIGLNQIIGTSEAIRQQIRKVERYAQSDAAVLISGETGTGKEVFARAIHYSGRRAPYPFQPVNCAALPLELIENELFGHESGAFTGARQAHAGLIREAEGGSLFLDEIDSLPASAQAKLLRLLQEGEYRPLGAARNRRADVRIISASNSDLAAAVQAGRMRQDLYFRLNILPLTLPPLRERPGDISLIASHLVRDREEPQARAGLRFSEQALRKLEAYDWPGNVRELENVIERAVVLSDADVIEAGHIDIPVVSTGDSLESFKAQKLKIIVSFERRYLADILAQNGGNITRAARAAHKDRRAFFELLRKHNLCTGRSRAPASGRSPAI